MANNNIAKGLVPIGLATGGPVTGRITTYYVPATDSTPLGLFDPVKSAGSATADGRYATVTRAAAGDALRGVVVGFDRVKEVAIGSENFNLKHRPASVAMYVRVLDDPDAEYAIREDNSATFAATMVGENADLATVTDCNTTTGYSDVELSTTSHTSSAAQLRILGVLDKPDNELAANCLLRVKINEHELASTSGV